MEETRIVTGAWELSTFRFNIEGRGLQLMLENTKERKLVGIKCGRCGTVYMPGPFYCRKCHQRIDEPVEVGDRGEIMTFTIGYADVRGNPLDVPTIAPIVKLDGCDSWIMGVLQGCKPEDVHVGMRVRVKWAEETTGSLQDIQYFLPE